MRMDPDRALVNAVLEERPGAFEQLVRDYQGLCWYVIQRMVRHPEDTRELCQEAFLRVHRYLHQYRFDSPLKSWIGQVAYSVAKGCQWVVPYLFLSRLWALSAASSLVMAFTRSGRAVGRR